MSDKKIIYVKENTLESFLQDAFSFGIILASYYINYKFIGGNDALDVLLLICFVLFAMGRAGNFRKLKEAEKEL